MSKQVTPNQTQPTLSVVTEVDRLISKRQNIIINKREEKVIIQCLQSQSHCDQ